MNVQIGDIHRYPFKRTYSGTPAAGGCAGGLATGFITAGAKWKKRRLPPCVRSGLRLPEYHPPNNRENHRQGEDPSIDERGEPLGFCMYSRHLLPDPPGMPRFSLLAGRRERNVITGCMGSVAHAMIIPKDRSKIPAHWAAYKPACAGDRQDTFLRFPRSALFANAAPAVRDQKKRGRSKRDGKNAVRSSAKPAETLPWHRL